MPYRIDIRRKSTMDKRTTRKIMLFNRYQDIGFVLNIIQLIANSISFCVALVISIITIHHLKFARLKQRQKIIIILCCYIYVFLLILTTIMISINIKTLLGDLYNLHLDSPSCILFEYLTIVIFCTLYHVFVNQVSLFIREEILLIK